MPRCAEQAAVLVVVVAAVGEQPRRAAGAAGRRVPRTGGTRSSSGDQLGDVVAVAAGERPGERDPVASTRRWCLEPLLAPIDRARARFGAPFFACTWLPVGDRPRPLDLAGRAQLAPAAARAAAPTPRPAATHQAAASTSARAEAELLRQMHPRRSPCAARTGSPAAPADQAAACGPDSETAAPSSAAAARSSSHNSSDTTHGARTATGTPSSLTTDADGLRRQRTGPFILQSVLSRRRDSNPRPPVYKTGALPAELLRRGPS